MLYQSHDLPGHKFLGCQQEKIDQEQAFRNEFSYRVIAQRVFNVVICDTHVYVSCIFERQWRRALSFLMLKTLLLLAVDLE